MGFNSAFKGLMALAHGHKCALDHVSDCLPYFNTTGLPTPQPLLAVVGTEPQVVTQAC